MHRRARHNPALKPYFAVADGLAALFGPFVEAIVHDLNTDSVAHIAQPFSPRTIGNPSDLRSLHFDSRTQVIGPYEKTNFDGRRIKSISVVLRDADARAIGMLCVNADVTQFESMRRLLQGFLGVSEPGNVARGLFKDDWHEKVNRFIAAWTAEHSTTVEGLNRDERRALIEALRSTGGFDRRHAPAYLASILGVSRATLYNELARLKSSRAAA
jgi:predicted transcriptional regulator YheO